jgi:NAD(P)-dependent dehydrogenase (short-subunit alcohol dehydrogenase family)
VQIALVSRSENKLETVADACRKQGATAAVFPCDVTDDDAVQQTAQAILDRWGAPDVLVNNAGLFQPGSVQDTSPALFREQVAVNLTSAFVMTQAFLPTMLDRGRGHLFYMGSVASIRGYPGGIAYCAAKHGLLGLARVVREETKAHGLRVTTILPGATITPSWSGTDLPASRFMPPEDIAVAVISTYRLSDHTVVEELLLRPQLGDI